MSDDYAQVVHEAFYVDAGDLELLEARGFTPAEPPIQLDEVDGCVGPWYGKG